MRDFIYEFGWHVFGFVALFVIVVLASCLLSYFKKMRAYRRELERYRAEERARAAEAREVRPVKEVKPLTYEESVAAWNRLMLDREDDIRRAQQTAQAMAVEEDKPTLLTIYDYYATPDDSPIVSIAELSPDDPRYKQHAPDYPCLIVDDQRSLPHEQAGYGYLPRHIREQWVAKCRSRRAAILGAGSHETEKDIASSKAHYADLTKAADAAFIGALPEIRAAAVAKARDVFLSDPKRIKSIHKEANNRRTSFAVVADEFVERVANEAVDAALAAYKNGSFDHSALPELAVKRNMFTF